MLHYIALKMAVCSGQTEVRGDADPTEKLCIFNISKHEACSEPNLICIVLKIELRLTIRFESLSAHQRARLRQAGEKYLSCRHLVMQPCRRPASSSSCPEHNISANADAAH